MNFLFLDSISTGEVVVILLFILLFFGAESIPKLARTLGRTVRQVKDATQDIQRDIQDSMKDSVGNDYKKVEQSVRKTIDDTKKAASSNLSAIEKPLKDIKLDK